jgi:DNA-directed RNA polymerase specialized sigma24 family protein
VINAMAAGAPDDVDTYRRHAGELIRYATALVGPDDAPDVVTDGVLAAFATPGWSDVVNRRAYLYRAVPPATGTRRRPACRVERGGSGLVG